MVNVRFATADDCAAIRTVHEAAFGHTQGAQGKGVGGALVNAGLRLLAAAGVALVFVLGYPDYYSRSDSARRGRWVWPRLIQSPPSMTPPGWCWRCGRACSARYMAWCSAPIP